MPVLFEWSLDAVVEQTVVQIALAVFGQYFLESAVAHEFSDAVVQPQPDAASRAATVTGTFFRCHDTVNNGDGAFHCLKDVEQGDFLGVLCKEETAFHASD